VLKYANMIFECIRKVFLADMKQMFDPFSSPSLPPLYSGLPYLKKLDSS